MPQVLCHYLQLKLFFIPFCLFFCLKVLKCLFGAVRKYELSRAGLQQRAVQLLSSPATVPWAAARALAQDPAVVPVLRRDPKLQAQLRCSSGSQHRRDAGAVIRVSPSLLGVLYLKEVLPR